jgi:hypothetical protein
LFQEKVAGDEIAKIEHNILLSPRVRPPQTHTIHSTFFPSISIGQEAIPTKAKANN